MTLSVTHAKISSVANDAAASAAGEVLPSDWNAAHTLAGTADATQLNANVVQAITNDTNVTGSIAGQTLTLGWTGTLAAARLNANVVQGVTNDTNITATIAAQNLTFAWAGTLANARLATMAAHTLKGNDTTGTATPTDLNIIPWTARLHQDNGGVNAGHNLMWSDQNSNISCDYVTISSGDGSLIQQVTIGGSPGSGDTVTVTATINSVAYPVVYTVQTGDTTSTVATAVAAALNGGTTHATGGPALVAAYAAFLGADGIGYLPSAAATGAIVSLDLPWASSGNSLAVSKTGSVTVSVTAGTTTDLGPAVNIGRNIHGRTPLATDQYGNIKFNFASGATTDYDSFSFICQRYESGTSGSPYTSIFIAPNYGGKIGTPALYAGPGGISLSDTDGSGNTVGCFTGTHAANDPGPGGMSVPGRMFVGTHGQSGIIPGSSSILNVYGSGTFNGGHVNIANTFGVQLLMASGNSAQLVSGAGGGAFFDMGSSAKSFGIRDDSHNSALAVLGPSDATNPYLSINTGAASTLAAAVSDFFGTLDASSSTAASVQFHGGIAVAKKINAGSSISGTSVILKGATSGTTTVQAAATAGSTTITLPAGTTDFSATGGTSQVVKQTSSGAAFTVGQLAFTDISDTAWTSYTPSIAASTGTLTTASATGRWKQHGKTVFVEIVGVITTNGTGATRIDLGLPTASANNSYFIAGVENGLTNKQLNGAINGSSTSLVNVRFYDGTYPGASGANLVMTGIYEGA